MKKIIMALIIGLCFCSGCGKVSVSNIQGNSTDLPNEILVEKTDDNIDEQIRILKDVLVDRLKTEQFLAGNNYCTVTDLNHNGRLELIYAFYGGQGQYTNFSIYEIDSKLQSAIIVIDCWDDNIYSRVPDIVNDCWEGVYDEENESYKYYVPDIFRDGIIVGYYEMMEISFSDTCEIRRMYCMENELDLDGEIVSTYYDSNYANISKQEYFLMANELSEKFNISYRINWLSLESYDDINELEYNLSDI